MHELIEKYGKQTISELLDLMFICENPTSEQWKKFLIRSGILSKTSKANIQGHIFKTPITREMRRNQETGRMESVPIDPYVHYQVYCKNGRGEILFKANFTSKTLDQIKKELYENETNQNHEQFPRY